MAALAGQRRVAPLERIGAPLVHLDREGGHLVALHRVARRAVGGTPRQSRAARVGVPVTRPAPVERRLRPPRLHGIVARGARHRGVAPAQRVAGPVVVEAGLPDLVPAGRRVASLTVRAEPPRVRVGMAARAGRLEAEPGGVVVALPDARGGRALLVLRLVAVAAGQCGVLPVERVARVGVVEPVRAPRIPAHEREVGAGVVRVALRALGLACARVEAAVLLPHPGDLRVAGEAARAHVGARGMAREAPGDGIQLVVRRRERPRRHLRTRRREGARQREGRGDRRHGGAREALSGRRPPPPFTPRQRRGPRRWRAPSRRCGRRLAAGTRAAPRRRSG